MKKVPFQFAADGYACVSLGLVWRNVLKIENAMVERVETMYYHVGASYDMLNEL